MINNSTPNELNITKLRAGRYLASFNINGVTEQVLLEREFDRTWEIVSCISWNTDFGLSGIDTLKEAKAILAYSIEDQAELDADKTYGEPSADHKAFVKNILSN